MEKKVVRSPGRNAFVIEYEKMINDYRLVVIFQGLGHRCGYVGLPENHTLVGKGAGDDDLQNLDVHGGITWASTISKFDDKRWYIGFDCAHHGDGTDIETLEKYGLLGLRFRHTPFVMPGTVRTLDYVIKETKNLLEQIKESVV